MITKTFDLPILDWIAEHLHCPLLDSVMPFFTHLGDGGILWIALAMVLIFLPRHRKTGISMALALLMGLVVCNLTLKPLVGRLRPFDYQLQYFDRVIPLLIEAPADFSFPSGHTIASFEAASVLLLRKRSWGIAAMILAGLIAFSRLYLYVHYPTDVLFSVALGILFGLMAHLIVDKGAALYNKRKTN